MVEQPHFDDERTVLSARRVVPLEAIEAKVKHRRRWFLGSAFAIAMFLGAASALVSAYFKLRHQPEAELQPAAVATAPEPVAEPTVETPPPPAEQTIEKIQTDEKIQAQPVVKVVRPKRQLPAVRNTNDPRVSEDEALRQGRDSVLVDQWEERRARRVERRERRRAQHHDRDISNIDEIFEGRRRP
jgi:hypothetical protein